MTKKDLIKRIGERFPFLQERESVLIVDSIFDKIAKTLAEGSRVELRGFGTLSTRQRNAKRGRNPRTGERVDVPMKVAIHFKAGKHLLIRLNEAKTSD